MENNSENKLKKQWGERWKTGKSGRLMETHVAESPSFVVHPDYLHKYGTLSNGVVTKSIKYAETWLYGTVGVRNTPTHRPSLFLYPGVVKPAPRIVPQNGQAGYISGPGNFVPIPMSKYQCVDRNGTVKSHKLPEHRSILKTPEQCQCGDYRRDSKKNAISPCKKCGGKKTVNGTIRGTIHPHRATLLEITTSHDKPNPPAKAQDPYNMMRKNRLSVGELTETSLFHPDNSHKRLKSKSLSPARGKVRDLPSPSFETFKPKQTNEELKNWKAEEDWTNDDEEDDRMKRKSILECDLNAYELNRKGSDDSSDELSDGTMEVNSKLKILRPKLAKTDLKNRKIKIPEPDKVNPSEKTEVRVSGQRFKIFDHSNPSTEAVEGYVSDDQDVCKDVYIPRLTSPKRPPRKLKEKLTKENSFKLSKSKSKSSPNLSIKSILKKPTGNEDSFTSDSSSPNSADAEQSSPAEKRREILIQSVHANGKSNTFRKKKQVQFKVNVSNESLTDKQTESNTSEDTTNEETQRRTKLNSEIVQRSISCEDLLLANNSIQAGNDVAEEKTETTQRKELVKGESNASNTEGTY